MDFQEDVPLKAVSRAMRIPTSTLRRHRNRKVSEPGKASVGRFQPVLGIDMEKTLRDHMMEKALFGLTKNDVRHLAYEIAEKMGVNQPFSHKAKAAGYDWLHVILSVTT